MKISLSRNLQVFSSGQTQVLTKNNYYKDIDEDLSDVVIRPFVKSSKMYVRLKSSVFEVFSIDTLK